jgi:hypothetical protein
MMAVQWEESKTYCGFARWSEFLPSRGGSLSMAGVSYGVVPTSTINYSHRLKLYSQRLAPDMEIHVSFLFFWKTGLELHNLH